MFNIRNKTVARSALVGLFAAVVMAGSYAADAPVVDAYAQGLDVVPKQQRVMAGDEQQANADSVDQDSDVSSSLSNQVAEAQQAQQPLVNNQGQTNVNQAVPPQQLVTRNQTQLLQQISQLQQQMQNLQGQLELQKHNLSLLRNEQRAMYDDLDARLNKAGTSKQASMQYRAPAPNSNNASNTTSQGMSLDLDTGDVQHANTGAVSTAAPQTQAKQYDNNADKLAYNSAYQEIQNKNYSQANSDLRGFLARYPDSEFAPNAHYWLGELNLLSGDIKTAVSEFGTVVNKYPKDHKAADSMLKLGMIYYGQGNWQKARDEFGKVNKQFPQSPSARLASNRLQQMDRQGR